MAIHARQAYDDNSRLITRTDDNGNATTYAYDPLDRLVAVTLADGTHETATYDVHDNLASSTDANGTVVTPIYDLLNRVTRTDVAVGPGVSADTTFTSFVYDGLSRLDRATDDDSWWSAATIHCRNWSARCSTATRRGGHMTAPATRCR